MISKFTAVAAVMALACAPAAALAQVSQATAFPQFRGPAGIQVPPGLQAVVGADAQTGQPCLVGVASGCRLPAADPANASYANATTLVASGAAIAASRGVAADCTASGVVVLAMAGGGTLSWSVTAGHQNQPYAITAIASSTATCSYWGLN